MVFLLMRAQSSMIFCFDIVGPMAKQIVWVFGASGAGKATFINYVLQNKSPELMTRMGWQGKSVTAEPYSLSLVGLISYHDDKTRKRSKILPSARSLQEAYDVVLIKGQQVDIDNRRPRRLQSELSRCTHRIIYLDAGIEQIRRRIRQKPWWNDTITTADIEAWRQSQLKILKNLVGFELQVLQSSKGFAYTRTDESNTLSTESV